MPGSVKKEQKEAGRIILNGPLFPRIRQVYILNCRVTLKKKIAIQYIHPILNVNTLKCFNIKTLKYQNVEILKLQS